MKPTSLGLMLVGVGGAAALAYKALSGREKNGGPDSTGHKPDSAGSGPRIVSACASISDPRKRRRCYLSKRDRSKRKPIRWSEKSSSEGGRCKSNRKGVYGAVMDGECGVIWAPSYNAIAADHAAVLLEEMGNPEDHICKAVKKNPGTDREFWTAHPDMVELVHRVLGRMFGMDLMHEWPPTPESSYLANVTWNMAMAAVLRDACGYVPET